MLFNVLSLVLLILFIDGFIQFIFGKNIIGLAPPLQGRISSFFGDESKMGSFIARLLPFYVALFFLNFKGNKKKTVFLNSILLLAPIIIIISGERMSLMIYFIFLTLIFNQLTNKIKILLAIALILIINFNFNKDFVMRYIISPLAYQDKEKDLTYFDFKNIKEENKKTFLDRKFTAYTPYYHSHYFSAFLMFKDSPLIGQGVNSYRLKCSEFDFKIHNKSCTTHPHNLNLQLLAEIGFIGYLFYLFFLYFLVKKIFLSYRKNNLSYNLNLNFFFVVNLFPLISSGNFFNNWQSILFFLPLGFLINNHYKVKE
jgi:O-antigen ligase